MIDKGLHLHTDKIVAMDVEYGGGRTVPRIAVVNFNEDVLYYSDFCLRYEDWIETKLTQAKESESMAAGLDEVDHQPLIHYSEKERPEKKENEAGSGNDSDISDDEDLKAEIAEF